MVLAYKFFFCGVPDNQRLSTLWRGKWRTVSGRSERPPRGQSKPAVADLPTCFFSRSRGRPAFGPGRRGGASDAPFGVGSRLLPGRPPGLFGPEFLGRGRRSLGG